MLDGVGKNIYPALCPRMCAKAVLGVCILQYKVMLECEVNAITTVNTVRGFRSTSLHKVYRDD